MADRSRNEVAIEIEAMLTEAEAPRSNNCCIYKVPDRLRRLNQDAYTPKVVSIGPFHHRSPTLQNAEREKQIFLRKFIQRTNTDLDSLVSHVEKLEPRVRDCYSKHIEFNKRELVKIILVDAGFILEVFIYRVLKDWNKGDILSLNSWLHPDVLRDFLLLENQLPFFVLDELYGFAHLDCPLLNLMFKVYKIFNLQHMAPQSVTVNPLHFTDLLRTFHLQLESNRPPYNLESRKEELLYSVTRLHEAGVKLKANPQEGRCLLDLKLSGHSLEIPQLEVYDMTEILFRNMLALEQCHHHYRFQSYITDYVMVLDYLINKESDVDILVRKRIVKNWLGGNNDVAKLVNGLGKNIIHKNLNSDYHVICQNLNAFCDDPWHIRKATLRRDYCSTPWRTAASVAAILILIMTLIQTVFSVLQVVL